MPPADKSSKQKLTSISGIFKALISRGTREVLAMGDAEVEMARRKGVNVVRKVENCIVVVFGGLLMDRSLF